MVAIGFGSRHSGAIPSLVNARRSLGRKDRTPDSNLRCLSPHARLATPTTLAIAYVAMADIDDRILARELKKGSAELIVLSIVEARARHGYEISKLIESQSGGELKFHVASLYPLLYRLEERGWLRAAGWRRPASGAGGSTV